MYIYIYTYIYIYIYIHVIHSTLLFTHMLISTNASTGCTKVLVITYDIGYVPMSPPPCARLNIQRLNILCICVYIEILMYTIH